MIAGQNASCDQGLALTDRQYCAVKNSSFVLQKSHKDMVLLPHHSAAYGRVLTLGRKGCELIGILLSGFNSPFSFMDIQYPLLIWAKSTVDATAGLLYKSSMYPYVGHIEMNIFLTCQAEVVYTSQSCL